MANNKERIFHWRKVRWDRFYPFSLLFLLQPLSLCYGGKPGTNGIPGMHGTPASPGAPGRDGRDGAKGDQGSLGKTGPKGPAGAEGKKGDKGESGTHGAVGQKGQRGEKGESGTPGSPQLSSHMNWKECAWKRYDVKDSGLIQVSDIQHKRTCIQQSSVNGGPLLSPRQMTLLL